MPNSAEQFHNSRQFELFNQALNRGALEQVQHMINGFAAADIAHLIDSSPPHARNIVWQLIDEEVRPEVLQELGDDVQADFLEQMERQEVAALVDELDSDDFTDLLQQLPERVTAEVLELVSEQDRTRIESLLQYDEDTAGGLMDTDSITVRPRFTLEVVLRYLRRHDSLPDNTDALFVVNRRDELVGILPLTTIITHDPNVTVREVMITDVEGINASTPDSEVARMFERNDWISAPVVNDQGALLGRITVDDVVDVIRDDADHSLMSMAGLDEDQDTFATAPRTFPRRAIWLAANLCAAFISASVINLFEETIEQVVALAILMPIVASMGGVAGSQTLTVMIRGLALGQISSLNKRWLLQRELLIGFGHGILWASTVGVIAYLWFDDPTIGFVIGIALVINLLTAAAAGTLLPLILKAMKIDPALAGGMAITTITDVVGFLSFLGLATIFFT